MSFVTGAERGGTTERGSDSILRERRRQSFDCGQDDVCTYRCAHGPIVLSKG